ncbi:MAG: MerR family transcriptional regulator [Ilumatobacteraceae bacterium]
MPIGMFSRASSLSIKSLRAHHESGLLVPASVDPRTGYRAYTVDQLADAAVIARLRTLDVPLAEVREVLDARDPEITRKVLDRHQAVMEERLAQTVRIIAELQSEPSPALHTPVHVRTEAATHTLRARATVDATTFAVWLERAFRTLAVVAAMSGAERNGPPGALFGPEILDDRAEEVEAFLPIAEPVALRHPGGVAVGELPARTVAVLVHAGPYETLGDTYRTLGAWVARHAEHAGDRTREWYVVGPGDTPDESAWRTEVAWPINDPALDKSTTDHRSTP